MAPRRPACWALCHVEMGTLRQSPSWQRSPSLRWASARRPSRERACQAQRGHERRRQQVRGARASCGPSRRRRGRTTLAEMKSEMWEIDCGSGKTKLTSVDALCGARRRFEQPVHPLRLEFDPHALPRPHTTRAATRRARRRARARVQRGRRSCMPSSVVLPRFAPKEVIFSPCLPPPCTRLRQQDALSLPAPQVEHVRERPSCP